MFESSLSDVLILENESGQVYIVEGKEKAKIAKSEKDERSILIFDECSSPVKSENQNLIKIEPDEVECHLPSTPYSYEVPFIDVQPYKDESPNIKTVTPSKSNQPDKCKYCEEKFKTRNDLWMHICKYLQCDSLNFICRICLKHIPKKDFHSHNHEVFTCLQCGKPFSSSKSLELHDETMHGRRKMFCDSSSEFETSSDDETEEVPKEILNPMNQLLRRNGVINKKNRNCWPRRRNTKKLKLECDKCGKYLASHKSLEYHMNLHRSRPSFICVTCGESFFTPNGIRAHNCDNKKRKRPDIDFRVNDTRYCRFCDQKFSSFDENKAHKCEFAHAEDSKLVICRVCGKTLKRLAFNRHMEIHSDVPWVCEICSKKLATSRALKLHFTTHSGNKPYKCTDCDETFISKIVLDRHMRFHGQAPKLSRCEFCFKELSTELSLKSHIQRLHSTSSQCELCKMKFPNKEILKEHIQSTHPPSTCQACGKSFSLPRYLKMHMKLHYDNAVDGNKISCQFCSKTQLLRNLKSHVYRSHPAQFELWMSENPNF